MTTTTNTLCRRGAEIAVRSMEKVDDGSAWFGVQWIDLAAWCASCGFVDLANRCMTHAENHVTGDTP